MDENGNCGYVYITINAVSGFINVDNECHTNYNLHNLTTSTLTRQIYGFDSRGALAENAQNYRDGGAMCPIALTIMTWCLQILHICTNQSRNSRNIGPVKWRGVPWYGICMEKQ